MDNHGLFVAYGVVFLHGSYYMLWKVKFEPFILTLDAYILLPISYGTQDESNEEAKKIILKGLSNHDVAKVRHCKTAKQIMGKLNILYGRERNQDSKIIEKSHCILE